jgi:hypothetical protein
VAAAPRGVMVFDRGMARFAPDPQGARLDAIARAYAGPKQPPPRPPG